MKRISRNRKVQMLYIHLLRVCDLVTQVFAINLLLPIVLLIGSSLDRWYKLKNYLYAINKRT